MSDTPAECLTVGGLPPGENRQRSGRRHCADARRSADPLPLVMIRFWQVARSSEYR